MSQKTEKIEVRVTEEEKVKIKVFAAKHNKSMSDVIRECCKDLLNQMGV